MTLTTPRPRCSAPGEHRATRGRTPAAQAFDAAPVALAVVDCRGRWVQVNQQLCELLGYPAQALIGQDYQDVTHPEDGGADADATAALLDDGVPGIPVEKRYLHASGRPVWVRVTANLLPGDAGAVVVIEDIGARRLRDAELSRLALHDPLTGVRNRALLDDDIDAALRARDADGGVVVVLYLDVDDFKGINDAHGHETGDLALVVLTTRLRDLRRDSDTVARLGGDEFALVAHLPDARGVGRLRERVSQVCAEPLMVADRVVPMAVSVGMVVVDTPGWTATRALAAADAAMYAAKRNGKGTS